jgi:hypothetical protein
MDGYSVGISTGIISPNEARRKENMPPLPEKEGGNFHIVNGTFIKLKDVGQQYGVEAGDVGKPETGEEPKKEPKQEEPDEGEDGKEEQHENKRHTERHEERRRARR